MIQNINKFQSFSGRLRERFDEIEDLLSRGIKQEYILELFKQEGFDVSAGALRSTIHRIRKERAKSSPKPPQNRPQAMRRSAGITEPKTTSQKCDFAQRLNSVTHEELFGEVKK